MADVKWIKIVTDIFDDEKIRFIETMPNGDEIVVIWFKLLCLAGKSNSSGFLMFTSRLAYTEEMLASIFNRDIKVIHMALGVFEQLEMVEITEHGIHISNWDKHQSLDKLEAKKLYDREYQKKRYQEKKLLLENRTSIVRESNENRIADIEEEKEKELYINIVEYLNQKASTNYKATTKKTQTCIHARLAEGFTLEDFKAVIDKKCVEWIGTEWEKYLRPETLFGTKFESYLNAKTSEKSKPGIDASKTDLDDIWSD